MHGEHGVLACACSGCSCMLLTMSSFGEGVAAWTAIGAIGLAAARHKQQPKRITGSSWAMLQQFTPMDRPASC